MKTNTFLTGAVLAAGLAGCGEVDGIPIEKTSTDFAKAICPKAYDCCTPEQLMPNKDLAGTTEPECEVKTADHFRSRMQTMQASQNAGRARFDQEQVDACLEAIRASNCSQLQTIRSLSGLPACDSSFATPLVAIGGTCGQDYECIGGVCQKAAGAWEGVCVAGASIGGSCSSDSSSRCAPDLTCDPRDGNVDTDNVCVAEQDNGAACSSNLECKTRICAAASGATAKTCQAPSGPVCFYGGGCAAAGGRPGAAALLIMAAFAAVAMLRGRRSSARDRR
jgi:hypothetical protein